MEGGIGVCGHCVLTQLHFAVQSIIHRKLKASAQRCGSLNRQYLVLQSNPKLPSPGRAGPGRAVLQLQPVKNGNYLVGESLDK